MNTRFKGPEDKQAAIAEHRKMWDWIANHLNPDIGIGVQELKCEYLKEHEKEHEIESGCYLCDFVGCVLNSPDNNLIPNPENEFSTCDYCPVTWGTENPDDKCVFAIDKDTGERKPGLYRRVMLACEKRNWGTARELAMKIRDLPERELPQFLGKRYSDGLLGRALQSLVKEVIGE